MLITCQNDTILDMLRERKCISGIDFTFLFDFSEGWFVPIVPAGSRGPGARAAVQGAPGGGDASVHPHGSLGYHQLGPGQVTRRGSGPQGPLPLGKGNNNNYYLAGLGRRGHVKYEERRLALQDVLSEGSLCFSHRFAWARAPFFPAGPPDLGLPPEQPPLCRRGEGGPPRWLPWPPWQEGRAASRGVASKRLPC